MIIIYCFDPFQVPEIRNIELSQVPEAVNSVIVPVIFPTIVVPEVYSAFISPVSESCPSKSKMTLPDVRVPVAFPVLSIAAVHVPSCVSPEYVPFQMPSNLSYGFNC